MDEYDSLASHEGEGHFIRSELPSLLDSEAIVFDLDGTLVDSRMSLDESLLSTVRIMFASISGIILPRERISKAAFELKKTGGFNNPWDVAYSLTLALATSLSEDCILKVAEILESGQPSLQELLSKRSAECTPEDVTGCLEEVVQYADERGNQSIVEGIERLYGGKKKKEAMKVLQNALKYPGTVPESLIPAVFDSFFLGSKKYKEVHSSQPPIDLSVGLWSNERGIMEPETASYFKRRFTGGAGLATGRPKYAAEMSLPSHVLQLLVPGAATYFDDVVEEERRRLDRGDRTSPGKPDPFSLKHAVSALKPGRGLIYVGDSTEDLLMARRMEGYGENVHFVGVYRYAAEPRAMEKLFLQLGASAVLPSVNQLRNLLS